MQIGFNTVVHNINSLIFVLENLFPYNLVLRTRERVFRIQLFDLMCGFRVDLLPCVRTKYLTVSDEGIDVCFTLKRVVKFMF